MACALQGVDAHLAKQHHLKVVQLSDQSLGAKHPDSLTFRHDLAIALRKLGRLEEAKELMQDVLHHQRRLLGKNNLVTRPVRSGRGPQKGHALRLKTGFSLACILRKAGKLEEAEELHRKVLDSRQKILGAALTC